MPPPLLHCYSSSGNVKRPFWPAITNVSPHSSDLKDAMRAKDINRLSVLRSILAEVTNLSKTNNPIKKDVQLLVLLRKRSAMAKIAADEFKAHQRPDLAEKEELQGRILEGYVGQVDVVGEAEIRSVVERMVGELRRSGGKLDVGVVVKSVLSEGGELNGKPVDRGELARLVKEILGTKE
jgi:uncharacterized protein